MSVRCKQGWNEDGFSLVEVMVAAVLLLVGAFSILAVLPRAYDTTTDSGRKSVLNHLASEKLEELMTLDYSHALLSDGTHPAMAMDSRGASYYPVAGFPEDYSLRWTVSAGPTDAGGTPEPDMKTLVVEATYRVRYTTLGSIPIPEPASIQSSFQTFLTDK